MAEGENLQGWKAASGKEKKEPAVMVEFSPNVLAHFAQLEETVRDSKQFDPGILENLREYSVARPMPMEHAVSAVAYITREAMKHLAATSDRATTDAVSELLEALSSSSPPCVRVVNRISKGR